MRISAFGLDMYGRHRKIEALRWFDLSKKTGARAEDDEDTQS